jgi:hypothetical protein
MEAWVRGHVVREKGGKRRRMNQANEPKRPKTRVFKEIPHGSRKRTHAGYL